MYMYKAVAMVTGAVLLPMPTQSPLTVVIVDPPDSELTVRHGHSFTLKCAVTGGQRRLITSRRSVSDRPSDVQELVKTNNNSSSNNNRWIGQRPSTYSSPISSLLWLHNGIPLSDGSSSSSTGSSSRARLNVQAGSGATGGGGAVCGRVVITEAIDVDTGWMTSLMTCRSAGSREAGVYQCRDSNGVASDDVTVSVDKQPSSGKRKATLRMIMLLLLVHKVDKWKNYLQGRKQ
jgi:hypothetical protein